VTTTLITSALLVVFRCLQNSMSSLNLQKIQQNERRPPTETIGQYQLSNHIEWCVYFLENLKANIFYGFIKFCFMIESGKEIFASFLLFVSSTQAFIMHSLKQCCANAVWGVSSLWQSYQRFRKMFLLPQMTTWRKHYYSQSSLFCKSL